MLNIKKDFPWIAQNKEWIYLDTGATSLKPQAVIDAINHYLITQSTNPHNHDSTFTHLAFDVMKECRISSARLINCLPEEIIFTSGATESLNLVSQSIAHKLIQDDEIILTHYEHSSNLLPWYNLAKQKNLKIKFAQNDQFNLSATDFTKLLSPKTKVVSFIGVSNVLGTALPIKEIVKAVKAYNPKIFVCVDLAQMVPHHQCDIAGWGVDFAVYSGHKIFADTGIGVAFIKKSLQPEILPLRFGGGMNTKIQTDEFIYAQGFEKFEGGTPNISGIYSLLAATNYLLSIGYEKIQAHENEIYELLYENLKDDANIEVYNWQAHSPILAFNIKGVYCQDTASFFGKHHFIVRSGLSCAKLLNNIIHVDGLVRASFYIYNDKDDVLNFIKFIKTLNKEKILHELI